MTPEFALAVESIHTPTERFFKMYSNRDLAVVAAMKKISHATLHGAANHISGGISVHVPEVFEKDQKEFDPFQYEFLVLLMHVFHKRGWSIKRHDIFMDRVVLKPLLPQEV